jgi:hypothetical protein
MSNKVTTTVVVNSSDAVRAFNQLGSSMTGAVAKGNLLASGIGAGLSSVVDMAGKVGGAIAGMFNNAAKSSLSNIGTAGDLARVTGMSFAESQKDIANFTLEMAKMSKDLPGSSEQFSQIGISLSDNLATGLKDVNGQLDLKTFREYRTEFAKFGAMRTEFSGVRLEDTNLFISKMLDGRSLAELKTLKFAESNVGVMAEMERQLKNSGKDLKDLSKREIIELAKSSLSIQDEVIKAAQNSTKGIIAGFKDGLFNKDAGIFGIMRDLNKKVDGNQSVFSSFERIVQKLLGENGVFAQSSEILQNLGLTSDPMQMLANGLGKFGAWLDKTNKWLSSIVSMSDDSRGFSAGKLLKELPAKLGSWLSKQVNKIFSGAANLDAKKLGGLVGNGLAAVINANMSYIRNLNFTGIAAGVLKIGMVAVVAAGVALSAVNWGNVGIVLLKGVLTAVAIGVAFCIAGIVGLSAPIAAAIAGVGAVAVGVFIGLKNWWAGQGESIKASISGLMNSITNTFSALRDQATAALNRVPGVNIGGGKVANKATGLDQMGLFGAIARERSAAPGTDIIVANSSEAILNRQQQRGLVSALNSRRGGGLRVGNLTINAGTVTDPKQLAKQVMRELGNEWSKYQQGQMSPSY